MDVLRLTKIAQEAVLEHYVLLGTVRLINSQQQELSWAYLVWTLRVWAAKTEING